MTEYALVPDNLAKKFRRGYYAAVSQTDHNFGILLDALDAFGLNSTTIVAFVGDHGWQLGDLGEFGKKTNFERATRAPFIIRDPRHKVPAGRSSALIEFVDLMPTLIDLAGFTVPTTCPEDSRLVALCVEGASLSPVLHNPNQTEDWKAAAFMQYAHCMVCPARTTLSLCYSTSATQSPHSHVSRSTRAHSRTLTYIPR
eukprot:m.123468 g.123468  ORF g.123468 m.123468 type:complete len:199 (-) comp22016_c0_seq1:32-628(-)